MPIRLRRNDCQQLSIEALTASAFAPFGTVIQNPSKISSPSPVLSVDANQGSATKYPDISLLVSSYGLARSSKPASPRLSLFSCRPRTLKRNANGQQVFDVDILERHPFTPQTFIPVGIAADDRDTAYLVIVAPTLPLTAADDRALHSVHHQPYPVPKGQTQPTLTQRLMASLPYSFSSGRKPSGTSSYSSVPEQHPHPIPKGPGPPDLENISAFIARGDQAVTYGAGTWHAPMVVLGQKTIDFVVVQYTNGVGAEDCQEVELYDGRLDAIIEDDLISQRNRRLVKL